MHDLNTIVQEAQSTLRALTGIQSARARLLHLQAFLTQHHDHLTHLPDTVAALLRTVPRLVEQTDFVGLSPDLLATLAHTLRRTEAIGGPEGRTPPDTAALRAALHCIETAQTNVEGWLSTPETPDHTTKAPSALLIPLIEEGTDVKTSGFLKPLRVHAFACIPDDADTIVLTSPHGDRSHALTDRLDNVTHAVRHLLATTGMDVVGKGFTGRLTLDTGGAHLSGTSANLGLALTLYTACTQHLGQRHYLRLLPHVAATGDVDNQGRVHPVDADTLAAKVCTVFFSPAHTLVLPAAQAPAARETLSALQARYPQRRLVLLPVAHLSELRQEERVLCSTRTPWPKHVLRSPKHRLFTSGLVALAFLAVLLSLGPRPYPPASPPAPATVTWHQYPDAATSFSLSQITTAAIQSDARGRYLERGVTLVRQSGGRIVVIGHTQAVTDQAQILVRFTPNGSLDDTFGDQGRVVTPWDQKVTGARAAVDDEDHIFVCGDTVEGIAETVTKGIVVMRYQPDGSLDPAFGTEGVFYEALSAHTDKCHVIALQPDGKVVLGGYTYSPDDDPAEYDPLFPPDKVLYLLRLLPNGRLDPTFGSEGIVRFDTTPYNESAAALAIQPDGKIMVVGYEGANRPEAQSARILVMRTTREGILDPTFGKGGRLHVPAPPDQQNITNDFGMGVRLRPDGRLIVLGYREPSEGTGQGRVSLYQYLPNGTPDPTFGIDGFYHHALPGFEGITLVRGFALLQDGSLLVSGTTRQDDRKQIHLLQIDRDGRQPPTVGVLGIGPEDSIGGGLVVDNDRHVYLTGRTTQEDDYLLTLIRVDLRAVSDASPTPRDLSPPARP